MDNQFKFTNAVLGVPLFFVLLLWFIYWLEIRFGFDFVRNGIYPRTFSGLQGVLFSPFIHSDLKHLYNNSLPLLVLLAALQFFYAKQSYAVIGFGILMSGILTWFIGRSSYHIGASGLIYVLVSFIFIKGILTRYYRLVALSLAVIMLYGGMLWYIFPEVDDTISWEGHLAGLISGLVLSIMYKTPEFKKPIKYEWERPEFDPAEDKFMERFDENGNFVNLPVVEIDEEEVEPLSSYFTSNYTVDYDIVVNEKNESRPES
ncbi:rhomboid family intramembrane serine protease [Flavobacterium hiemivividum]|uniref:Rhomboid family intramembrane serine protease n=1 Tax=Flavobacterium hiemivividum TaxID=2541734 RepID=A0A4R5CUW4_9FLAO|nr:rhomboid family intramembrane serine protease [Flavobacterium hiemivividum]TDE04492.1 rhomboid family intramembrane serine protease [Flavobacterium hiemivividum]